MAAQRSNTLAHVGPGTFTVLDLMLLVAASTLSVLLMRFLLPTEATWEDYLALIFFCAPAGLAVLGPWVMRRQFAEGNRDELYAGEWLWIALAGVWVTSSPLILLAQVSEFSISVGIWTLAVGCAIAGPIALGQSITSPRRFPWTHWAGIVLCFLHAAPLLTLAAL